MNMIIYSFVTFSFTNTLFGNYTILIFDNFIILDSNIFICRIIFLGINVFFNNYFCKILFYTGRIGYLWHQHTQIQLVLLQIYVHMSKSFTYLDTYLDTYVMIHIMKLRALLMVSAISRCFNTTINLLNKHSSHECGLSQSNNSIFQIEYI